MRTGHFREMCEHGTVVAQCRCPSPDKQKILVPCPPNCAGAAHQGEAMDHSEFSTTNTGQLYAANDGTSWRRTSLVCQFRPDDPSVCCFKQVDVGSQPKAVAWVYKGERRYIEGVPFGSWIEPGDHYVSTDQMDPADERLGIQQDDIELICEALVEAGNGAWSEIDGDGTDISLIVEHILRLGRGVHLDFLDYELVDKVAGVIARSDTPTPANIELARRVLHVIRSHTS